MKMVLDGKIIDKVSTNIKSRGDSIRTLVTSEIADAKTAFNQLMGLKPVQAVNGLVTKTVTNVGKLVDENAEITRKWASGL